MYRRKIKTLQQKVARKSKKINTMKELIQHLKKSSRCDDGIEEVVMNNFEGFQLEVFHSELRNSKISARQRRYSTEMKEFALTIYFYSPKAYNFLRKKLFLPHPAMLRKWLSVFNCEVGFLQEVFDFLKEQARTSDYLQDVALTFDSMAIRSQLLYDKKTDKHCGYVDLGNVSAVDSEELATEALVLMIVSYTKNFKCPIAYFFVNKISAIIQKQLILVAIQKLSEINISVRSVTCDGCIANIKTFEMLGCNLNPENIEAKFKFTHQISTSSGVGVTSTQQDCMDVFCILDPCHLLKLTRNAFAEVSISSPTGSIDFNFIVKLHLLQEKEDLKLANALTGSHVIFKQKKMNVRLAAQTISSSVADAIDFLRLSGNAEFQGSEATTEFIRIFDRIFDVMNSRTLFAKGYKSPLFLHNIHYWKQIFSETAIYIKGLKINGTNVLLHARKTFALGFLINIYSFAHLAEYLLTRSVMPLKYVITYKCSQDHLELFFSCIRSRGGWNNNPNVQQFKWAMRKLLFRNSVKPSVNGNCLINYSSDLAPVFDFKNPRRNIIENQNEDVELDDSNLNHFMSLVDLTSLSSFQNNILYYIGGVIVRKLLKKNSCSFCQEIITHQGTQDHTYLVDINDSSSFTRFVSNGKLYYPSKGVFEIVQYTERAFRAELAMGYLGQYDFKKRIVISVTQNFLSKLSSLFGNTHPMVEMNDELHEIQVLKYVANTYASIRIMTHSTKKTLQMLGQKATLRHKLNKTVLFYHI